MYLHLGKDVAVNTANIIAILDMDSTTISKSTRTFLKVVEEEGFVRNVSEDLPKTFVLCEINGQSVVYITNISSKTLMGRVERFSRPGEKGM